MSIRRSQFNLYLLLAVFVAVVCGCRTHKNDKDKQLATFRVHLEATADDSARHVTVPIFRANAVAVRIQEEPFLTEAHLAGAQVVDALGGFEIQVQLNRQGTWLLQDYSASNPGKHYAIFSQFGEKGKSSRWLAAPSFARIISNGILQFTPDASREEADQIVRGWNNIAKKNAEQSKW